MMEEVLEMGAALHGVREGDCVLGMAHRGRLSVLANICGKPVEEIFSEINGPTDPRMYLNRGDVKYHMGYSSDWIARSGQKVHLSMAFNPSHLGVVHPVVEGRARAKQDRAGEGGRHAILPLVVHGDAQFIGQGLVAETLNLSGLPGYDTGGTVHIDREQPDRLHDPQPTRAARRSTAPAWRRCSTSPCSTSTATTPRRACT